MQFLPSLKALGFLAHIIMPTRELYCPECRKKTRHTILPDDRISFNGNRVWRLSCDCGVFYSIQRKWSGLTDEIIEGLLSAREQCKMFWKPEEIEGEKKSGEFCPD